MVNDFVTVYLSHGEYPAPNHDKICCKPDKNFGAFRYDLQSIPKYERYQCRQVWSYKTRANEAHSNLSIVRIDKAKTGDIIFHVWLDDLNIENPNHPDGIIYELPHTPFTVAAMNSSVKRLI